MKFVIDSVFADIAAGSDGDVELRSGAVGDQVARPMIVVASRRKIEDFFTWASKMGVTVAVRKTPNAVGVIYSCSRALSMRARQRSRPSRASVS